MAEQLCCGYNELTYQPCQLATDPNRVTCYQHHHLYSKKRWISQFLVPNTALNLLTRFGPPNTVDDRQKRMIEDSIASGRIVLMKEDIEAMPNHRNLTVILLVLAKFPQINPLWNIPLIRRAIQVFYQYRINILRDVFPTVQGFFETLLQNPHVGLEKLVPLMIEEMVTYNKQNISPRQRVEFEGIWHELFYEPHPELFWYSNDYLAEKYVSLAIDSSHLHTTKEYIKTVVAPIMKQTIPTWKKERKQKMADIKEGAVMYVYHPRFVESWLETGGWPLFEMMT
jgi:hypothetical protein